MYFWKIKELDKSLASEPVNQLESLKYLAAFLIAKACLALEIAVHRYFVPPDPAFRILDITTPIVAPIMAVVGIIYCFVKNGGRKGSSFLQKLVALDWVMSIRFSIFVTLSIALVAVASVLLSSLRVLLVICDSKPLYLALVLWPIAFVAWALFYWRLGVHFANVRELEKTTQPEPDGAPLKPAMNLSFTVEENQMNDETGREILVQLRKLNRFSRLSLIFAAVFIGLMIGGLFSHDYLRDRSRSSAMPAPSWRQVENARNGEDNDEALRIATILRDKCPTDSYAESSLGYIYQAKGDLAKAEQHFARAYELVPKEEYEKALAAIRSVIARKAAANQVSEDAARKLAEPQH